MPRLTVTYQPEDSLHGEVTAVVDSAGYAGRSSAWFTVEELKRFCAALDQFPITADAPATLQGGYWNDDDTIRQAHVTLAIAPSDKVGGLITSVHLSTPADLNRDLQHSTVANLRTDYACLAAFRLSFLTLIAGQSEAAELEGQ